MMIWDLEKWSDFLRSHELLAGRPGLGYIARSPDLCPLLLTLQKTTPNITAACVLNQRTIENNPAHPSRWGPLLLSLAGTLTRVSSLLVFLLIIKWALANHVLTCLADWTLQQCLQPCWEVLYPNVRKPSYIMTFLALLMVLLTHRMPRSNAVLSFP